MRSGWYAQELFSTFHGKLAAIELVVGESGQFQVWANDQCLWDRKEQGGFPEIAELKRLLRDCIAPEASLGHCDLDSGGD